MNSITINNQEVQIKEYKGQRVVTLKEIDRVHNRPNETAGRNFRKNKKHPIENEDYFFVKPIKNQLDEIRRLGINSPQGGYLITETGYLMIVKSLTDDLAWQVQRELVKTYFRPRETSKVSVVPMLKQIKTYQGKPVMTIQEFSDIIGLSSSMLWWHVQRNKNFRGRNNDYGRLLTGDELKAYKTENNLVSYPASQLMILFEMGAVLLGKNLCIDKSAKNKIFEYFKVDTSNSLVNATFHEPLNYIDEAARMMLLNYFAMLSPAGKNRAIELVADCTEVLPYISI